MKFTRVSTLLHLSSMKREQWQALAGPILIIMILSMMILPLPPFILDLLFTFNITLSIIVLLVALFTRKVLDFAAFPTVLLFATLLRLSLNIASTRVILIDGHTGSAAAGRVIEAFGHFLVGGNFAIGIIIFIILIIINFMVITKGAGRIAEVGARFALDGMPGKQMAIDADLNAGLIGEDEAKRRRAEVTQEADFYGSMDGASKFVRGDAIAGLLIMGITIIGGLLVGSVQHGMPLSQAGHTYTLLTVGDGLVAQIPALIISTAAGIIVTRVGSEQNISQQMLEQLFHRPQILILAAGVIGLLGLIPGMPNLVFLLFTAALLTLSWWLKRQQERSLAAPATVVQKKQESSVVEVNWSDVQIEDTLAIEVGYGLIPMVDQHQRGELLGRIRSIRKKFAQEVGFLPPVIHISDNLNLPPYGYKVLMKGVTIAHSEVKNNQLLAINPGNVSGPLVGEATKEPAFGLEAVWIETKNREDAQLLGYTVVDTSTVIATHLNYLLNHYADELFGRQEAQELVNRVTQELPKLMEDFIPTTLTLTLFHKVIQNLIKEKVPIRDMRTIIETLIEHAPKQTDSFELTGIVRVALARAITEQWFAEQSEINVMGLDVGLERLLLQALQNGGGLEPGLAERLVTQTEQAIAQQEILGYSPILLVSHALRPMLSRFLRRSLSQLIVLSNLEIAADRVIKISTIIGSNK